MCQENIVLENLDLVPINKLLKGKFKFFIPRYQRGYRWTEDQVTDLLNDIYEFQENKSGSNEIYCLQPLVVKSHNDSKALDVIDGQQRLTTIHILLSYLEPGLQDKYSIEYETRTKDDQSSEKWKREIGSKEFLEKINDDKFRNSSSFHEIANANIDFYHIDLAYLTISNWFAAKFHINNITDKKNKFLGILKDDVRFIWYKTEEQDPIKVFTRLNIGKIPLTNSELIKALFLNKSNFKGKDVEQIRLQQVEIASEWDRIEYTLQNEEFWLFIHNLGWKKPTHIDFIFDLAMAKCKFGDFPDIGSDEHKTFRYFHEYFKKSKSSINAAWIRQTWHSVKEYFLIIEEWYNDLELYHYVGFLVEQGTNKDVVSNLIDHYTKEKDEFKEFVKAEIRKRINKCSDLTKTYGRNGEAKTLCRPLLLLHNIQTVIDQNKQLVQSRKYGLGTFYKFPFHLFKKEGKKSNGKGWEVEHIASNSGDNLTSEKNKEAWLASVAYCLPAEDPLRIKIENYFDNKANDFQVLQEDIENKAVENTLKGDDKQKIWNFALLDSTTNEEYQNDPFPVKRICILAKEHGHKAKLFYNHQNHSITIDKNENEIAFVPPCTKNVFVKAYTDMPSALNAWTVEDARDYALNINKVLSDAHFIDNQMDKIIKMFENHE